MINRVITLVALSAMIICLICAVYSIRESKKHQRQQDEILEVSISDKSKDGDKREIDFDRLRDINPDVIGWISIPDTRIEYPVLMSVRDDRDYYLKHDIYRNEDSHGCIYMHPWDVTLGSRNPLVVYGHNMKDGSMFGGLKTFLKKDFITKDYSIFFYTDSDKSRYVIKDIGVFYDEEAVNRINQFEGGLVLVTCNKNGQKLILHAIEEKE